MMELVIGKSRSRLSMESTAMCVCRLLTVVSLLWCHIPRTVCNTPQQIEISYTLVEHQNPTGAFIANLLQERAILDIIPESDLPGVQFEYLSDIPDIVNVEPSGIITVAKVIDREAICPNEETCEVQIDLIIRQPFTIIAVKIIIVDINDNDPEFEEPEITRHLQESTQIGSSFVLPSLTDLDSPENSVGDSFELLSNTHSFELRSTNKADGTKELRLVLKSPLDRESDPEYQLQVIARDNGDPSRSGSLDVHIIVTDTNDNHPVFDSDTYEVTIPENAPHGYSVATVHATDLDMGLNGQVVYSLSEDTTANLGHVFKVDNRTGRVTVIGEVDYEQSTILYLTIEAKDRGADPVPGETVVIVHVEDQNDNAPEITVHTLGGGQQTALKEGVQGDAFVARVVVSDKDSGDNGRYDCSLEEEHFVLGPLGSDFLVTAQGDLDRESQPAYNLAIICHDFGSERLATTARIAVNILDVNDNAPEFSQRMYYRELSENNAPGVILLQVNATDIDEGRNAEIQYSIESPLNDKFAVDPVSGIVKAVTSLDREDTARHQIVIVATDKADEPRSASATLVVDVTDTNDMPPKFTQDLYTFGIFENEDADAEVGYVQAEDDDDVPYNSFTFLLSGERGQRNLPLQISADTGRITTTRTLDREQHSLYSIVVVAVDTSEPYFSSSATVSVYVMDRNDNPPRFTFPSHNNNTVYVSNDVVVGHVITQVNAEDHDIDVNGRVKYEVIQASQEGLFVVDPYLGTVSVTSDLMSMDNVTFTLVIGASDNGENVMSTSSTLNIMVNKRKAGFGTSSNGDVSANVIIVVSVACVSGILIVALILAIVIMLRKQQHNRRKNNRHKSRMDALKVMAGTEAAMVKSPAAKQQFNSLNGSIHSDKPGSDIQKDIVGGPCDATIVNEAVYSMPKKNSKVDLSLEKSRQWLEQLEAVKAKGELDTSPRSLTASQPIAPHHGDIEITGHQNLHTVPRLPLKSCLKNPMPANHRKESGDNDSLNSGIVSNTDSGRGQSEQEESCRDIAFLPDGSQKSSFRQKTASPLLPTIPSYNTYHSGVPHDTSRTSSDFVSSPPRPPKQHIYGGPQKTLLADFLGNGSSSHNRLSLGQPLQTFGKTGSDRTNTNTGSPRPQMDPIRSSYRLDNTPALGDRRQVARGPLAASTAAVPDASSPQVYSLADVSGMLPESNGNSLASSCYRNGSHGDDGSSTSGSYVVDAKELAQEVDGVYFKDLVV